MADLSVEQAVALLKAGKVEAARGQLELILKNDRSNIPAWHWYARTWPGAQEKARIWQACLRYNPGDPHARQALKDLNVVPQPVSAPAPRPVTALPRRKTGSARGAAWLVIAVLAIAAASLWFLSNSIGPKDPGPYRHTQPVEYYLYVPRDYSADKEWPLFVGIHGAGGNGLNCWHLWQAYAEKEGYILLCPSIPGESFGFEVEVADNTVWAAIKEVQKEYRLRPRMFFAGVSAGAFFIQIFAYRYPRAVAGLAILSSGLYIEPAMFPEVVPMLVVIGGADNASAVRTSKAFVDELNGYGFNVQYKVLPGVGHTVTQEGVDMTLDLFRTGRRK